MSGIFPKKSGGGSFATSPVFGPVARRNSAAVELFSFAGSDGKSGFDGKNVKAEWVGPTLLINTDEGVLTQPVAEEAVRLIHEQIANIPATAAPNTLRARATAARAYKAGKAWALKRYSTREPGAAHSDRLFNDSGALAEQVRMNVRKSGVDIVTDVNGVRHKFVVQHRLRQLVPALGNGIGRYPGIKKALLRAAKAGIKREDRAFGKRLRGGSRLDRAFGGRFGK